MSQPTTSPISIASNRTSRRLAQCLSWSLVVVVLLSQAQSGHAALLVGGPSTPCPCTGQACQASCRFCGQRSVTCQCFPTTWSPPSYCSGLTCSSGTARSQCKAYGNKYDFLNCNTEVCGLLSYRAVCEADIDIPNGNCLQCNDGYTLISSALSYCVDINECATDNGGCDVHRNCTNTDGSFTCSACAAGWRDSGPGSSGNGAQGAGPGSCVDVNECATSSGGCGANTACFNTPGSVTCPCNLGYQPVSPTACTDINECALGQSGCDPLTTCLNSPGSYSCSPCPPGYSGNPKSGCQGNPCALPPPNPADGSYASSNCTNTPHRGVCRLVCNPGWAAAGNASCFAGNWSQPICTDINECQFNNGGCASIASCANQLGSRQCFCPVGFGGDGVTCTDINECATANGGCHFYSPSVRSVCTNKIGSFHCGAFILPGTLRSSGPYITTDFPGYVRPTDTTSNPLVNFLLFLGDVVGNDFTFLGFASPLRPLLLSWCFPVSFSFHVPTYFNVTCRVAPGVGPDLRLVLAYRIPGGAVANATIISNETLTFPPPTIKPFSLRTVDQMPSAVIAATPGQANLIFFQGTNFLENSTALTPPQQMAVYFGPVMDKYKYTCLIITIVSGYVACLTDAQAAGTGLVFTVDAGGQLFTGNDTLNYGAGPSISNITGCEPSPNFVGTINCPTAGGTTLIVTGTGFLLPFSIYVSGRSCYLSTDITNLGGGKFRAQCVLPEGAGMNREVYAVSAGSPSNSVPYVSYARPTITQLYSDQCTNQSPTSLIDCNRLGGSLVITGKHFGKNPASVVVGGVFCTGVVVSAVGNPTVDLTQTITCQFSSGTTANLNILIVQQVGEVSDETLLLSYEPCPIGTKLVGLACVACEEGTANNAVGQTSCPDCAAGRYANGTGNVACSACPDGTYQPQARQSLCLECAAGLYTLHDESFVCELCPTGKYTATNRTHGDCTPCSEGTVQTLPGGQSCRSCTPGRFATGDASQECEPCASGSYSDGQGNTTCAACGNGYVQTNSGESACVACTAGHHRPAGYPASLPCLECNPGSATNDSAQSSCTGCALGWVAFTSGADHCDACGPGTYSEGAQFKCADCASGRYTNNTAQTSCVECEPGRYAPGVQSTICLLCDKGKFSEGGLSKCRDCFSNSINPFVGASTCIPCLDGSTPNKNQSDCICGPGTYSVFHGNRSNCVDCPEGSVCPIEGIRADSVIAQDGYWKIPIEDTDPNFPVQMLRCVNPDFCVGGGCADGRTGPMCAVCVLGRSEWFNQCVPCTRTDYGVIIGALVVIWVYVMVLHQVSRKSSSAQTKILLYFVATAHLLLSDHHWLRWIISILSWTDFNPDQGGAGSICIAPLNPYQKWGFTATVPLMFSVVLIGNCALHFIFDWCFERRGRGFSEEHRFSVDHYVRTGVALLLFTYSSLTKIVFSYLNCVHPGGGLHVVYSAPAVDCDSDDYARWRVMIIILLIVPVLAAPIGLTVFFVYFYKKHGFKPDNMRERFKQRWGLFFETYKQSRFWWEVWGLVRRLILPAIAVGFAEQNDARQQLFVLFMGLVLGIHVWNKPFNYRWDNDMETGSLLCLLLLTGLLSDQFVQESTLRYVFCAFLILFPLTVWVSFFFYRKSLQVVQFVGDRRRAKTRSGNDSREESRTSRAHSRDNSKGDLQLASVMGLGSPDASNHGLGGVSDDEGSAVSTRSKSGSVAAATPIKSLLASPSLKGSARLGEVPEAPEEPSETGDSVPAAPEAPNDIPMVVDISRMD